VTIRRASAGELDRLPTPFLARTQRAGSAPHCIAVLAVRADEVVVSDPAQGRFVCARDDLLSEWTGLAITLDSPPASAATGRP
jgi:ABC-type bacteriocin/lantibiotic exporter with double-glycine peptidase domain